MDLLPYQLDPGCQALSRPRQHILIADAGGLGKTLEAGVLVSELINIGDPSAFMNVHDVQAEEAVTSAAIADGEGAESASMRVLRPKPTKGTTCSRCFWAPRRHSPNGPKIRKTRRRPCPCLPTTSPIARRPCTACASGIPACFSRQTQTDEP